MTSANRSQGLRGDEDGGRRTPLYGAQDRALELLWEPCMQRTCLLLLAVECLEEVEASLAGHVALEVLCFVERQARRVGPGAVSAWPS